MIKYQIDSASPTVCVFYRFTIATLILFATNFFLKKRLRFPLLNHRIFFLQGIFNFSLNYIFTYKAEIVAASAIVALTHTIMVHLNILGTWAFFKRPIHKNVVAGAFLGALGIYFLFYEDLHGLNAVALSVSGLVFGLTAAALSSAGNMFSFKNHLLKVPVVTANAWGMLYGTLLTGIVTLISGDSWAVPMTTQFWAALFYLSLFGTVFAFGAYMSLVGRIGADRAAYTSVISPVFAIAISAFFEDLKITGFLLAGMVLCLVGNVFTLYRARAAGNPVEVTS